MELPEVYVDVENWHGHRSMAASFYGPVKFTCNGDVNTLMVEHSIWEPRKLFLNSVPVGGKLTISSEPEEI